MLTNEMIKRIHDNAVAHGFHDPDVEPTFSEYCALIHEEISEAFSAWRNGEPDEYVKDGKPEGVWVELADVVIRCADALATYYSYDYKDVVLSSEIAQYSMSNFTTYLHGRVSCMDDGCSIKEQLCTIIWAIYIRAASCSIDLDAVIERKHAYNVTRPRLHGKRM